MKKAKPIDLMKDIKLSVELSYTSDLHQSFKDKIPDDQFKYLSAQITDTSVLKHFNTRADGPIRCNLIIEKKVGKMTLGQAVFA